MSELIKDLYSKFLSSSGVSTDTRSIQKGNIFFALSGPNFNGNQYASQALESGASFAIIDDEHYLKEGCVLVDDSLAALQELAKEHRAHFKNPVLAITGSNGKTTTKELCREVLSRSCNVKATKGNLNNHIGIPLTILEWDQNTEFAIVEMGANHQGEIAAYCEIAQPTHGLITNIGYAHTEGFGGIEGVLRGKSELFDWLRKSGGTPFINQQDERLKHMTKRFANAVTYPSTGVDEVTSTETLKLMIDDHEIVTHLTGSYNFINAAAAISVGKFFGVEDKEIASALKAYKPQNQRSQIIKRGSSTIIMDAYNANPSSMRAALQNLSQFTGRKVAILGDMNELEDSVEQHRQLGEEIAKLKLDDLILVGEKIKPILEILPSAQHFESAEALAETTWFTENTTFLLKASRSVKLERLIEKE